MLGAPCLLNGQYYPGKAQQVCWSPTPHLIIWYVLVLSCFYIQSRFPSKLTTGSPLWNLENNIRTKDQELRLSKFNFMKARCFYAATEQQCCRAAFGAEQSSSCITSRNFARTWDQLHGSKSWNFKKWRLSASHERLCPLHSFAFLCCLMLSYAVYSFDIWIHIWLCQPDPTLFYKSPFWRKAKESKPKRLQEIRLWKKHKKRQIRKVQMQNAMENTKNTLFFLPVLLLCSYLFSGVFLHFFRKKKRTKTAKKVAF